MRARRGRADRRQFWRGLIEAVRNRRGAVLLLTALSMSAMVMIVGFAVDYGFASYINQRLARAADTAAISAVSQDAATVAGGYGDVAALQMVGAAIYAENIKQLPMTGVTTNLTVTQNSDSSVTAVATYSYSVKTFFSRIFGLNTIPVTGSIQSTAKPTVYVNYYILVDTSQSMGIATTQADMTALYNRVVQYNNGSGGESGCVFGCHVKAPGQTYTNEQLAHNYSPTVTLRIDSAVQAIQSIVNTASSVVGTTKNIQIGLYEIQYNPVSGTYITTVTSPSNNYTNVYNLAGTINLGNNTSAGIGDSDFPNELTTFNNMLPANGSGVSAASPQNYVFIITDGVTDTYSSSCTSTHCTGTLDSTKCTPLKAKATVGVIYTTYLPLYSSNQPPTLEANYKTLVYPFTNQIAPALQACATSSSYYFQATYGSEIISAMQTLFNQTLPTSARLTQ